MAQGEPRTRYCSRCLTTFVNDADRCPNLGCRSARPTQGWGELLESGELIDRTYRVHRRLAIGGAGVTYLAREVGESEEVGPLLAVKVLYQQRDQGPYLRRLATEAQILQGLNHPQIVECRGFVHRAGHSPYLVTKFEAGGSLLDHIRRVGVLPPRGAAAVAMQVCDALAVAHRQGVIHRDLKPENVLLEAEVGLTDVPRVRVADFGIAKVFGGVGDRLTRVGAFIGTPQYAAPEQFEGMTPEPATDVYAVGALLYFCLTARPVAEFMAELDPEDQREHLIRHLPPRLPEVVGDERRWLEDSLAVAMAPDPGDRCGIDVLAERLHSVALGKDPGPISLPGGAPLPQRTLTLPPEALAPTNTISRGGAANAPLAGQLSALALPTPATTGPAAGGEPATHPSGSTPATPPVPVAPPPRTATSTTTGGRRSAIPGPTPTIERTVTSSAAKTSFGCLAIGLLGAGALALAGAAWWTLQDTPVALTGTETDPVAKADWQGIAYALGEAGPKAEKACDSPPYLAIEVVVQPDGTISRADLLNYAYEPTRRCIEEHLQAEKLPRKGTNLVRVAVSMVR
jgi:serine/threonine-protein kinase